MENITSNRRGLLALSPLLVFLCVYLISSIIANDFYKIPISAAFLIASVYAIIINRGKSLEDRVKVFSKGAGDSNVLLMIWIFVMAGAFAATAKEIGAIDATVNLAMRILPGRLLYAGLFLAACFISMSIGTSVGTIVALVPIAAGYLRNWLFRGQPDLLPAHPSLQQSLLEVHSSETTFRSYQIRQLPQHELRNALWLISSRQTSGLSAPRP